MIAGVSTENKDYDTFVSLDTFLETNVKYINFY